MSLRLRKLVTAVATSILVSVTAGQSVVFAQAAASPLLIAEFRTRGPNGKFDEFVKVYNNSDSPYTVQTSDGSGGFALVALSGSNQSPNLSQRFTIPNGTVIPARGLYLGALANGGSPIFRRRGHTLKGSVNPNVAEIPSRRRIATRI